jgi:hypothetical protein
MEKNIRTEDRRVTADNALKRRSTMGRNLPTHLRGRSTMGRNLPTHLRGLSTMGRNLPTHLRELSTMGRNLPTHLRRLSTMGRNAENSFLDVPPSGGTLLERFGRFQKYNS